ncbi:MAG TPA: hypothetical protein VFE15_13470 [Marmoricola sp.]|nr:hypothetical protein [Marmoricola sp.]
MTQPPEMNQPPENTPGAEIIGGPVRPVPPARPSPFAFDRDAAALQVPRVITAIGVGLISAAVVTGAVYSREHHDLDVSNFTMGVIGVVGLFAVAAFARLLIPRAEEDSNLVSWPGTAAALGTALLLSVLITNDNASQYTATLVLVALSALGYAATKAAPFVLAGILGTAGFYAKAFDDVFNTDGNGHNTFMLIGAGVLVFVIVLTLAGCLLPETRILIGVVVGAGGAVAIGVVLEALIFAKSIASYGFGLSGSVSDLGSSSSDSGLPGGIDIHPGGVVHHSNPYTNDAYMVLLYCLVLAVFWAACAAVTGHVGFRILVVAIVVLSIPMATFALTAHHPTWWEVAFGILGGLALLGAAVRTRGVPQGG